MCSSFKRTPGDLVDDAIILYYFFIALNNNCNTVEPCYIEVLGTMKITMLYQVSHYIRVKKQRNIKSSDQQNYLVIRGFCYIRPLYNEVPLYTVKLGYWLTEHKSISQFSKALIPSSFLLIFFFLMHCKAILTKFWSGKKEA